MKTCLPDDIARLMDEADFQFTAYRAFDKAPRSQSMAAAAAAGAVPTSLDPSQDEALDREATQILALTSAIQGRVATATSRNSPSSSGQAASVLPSTQTVHVSVSRTGEPFRALRTFTLHGALRAKTAIKTTVAIFGSAGGCGVTTIAATLARLLSESDESVVLVDGAPYSLLGTYFGLRNSCHGIRSIIHAGAEASANIHIASYSDAGSVNWVSEAAARLDGEFERMVVDVSTDFTPADMQRVLRGAVGLIPLLPDVRTVCSVEPLLQRLQTLGAECGVPPRFYFLLSQFDANVRLHCEIREWLSHTFGEMLLPITLRRADEISDALADGATVIDHAPNSGITHDFRQLAAWVKQLPRTEARG